jgi:UDP-N-acetylmuramate: L-alanyl-gamma-D-glutamyl-meso-diaminopimelate ligase
VKIHLIAICGVGMAPLAVMLKAAGHEVSGCDKAAFPPMSDVLSRSGIEVLKGFSPQHLDYGPDLVVIGNAVPASNPEAQAVESRGLPKVSFPEALSKFFLVDKKSLVVSGTHGKTTTTGMLARALQIANMDPGFLVGGLVRDLGDFAKAGTGDFFVVEGDEYDSAYFDKRPKFVHYQPHAAILTSIEFDHADIYRDLNHVKAAFEDLVGLVRDGSPIVACSDYPAVSEVLAQAKGKPITYGLGADGDWQVADLRVSEIGMTFSAKYAGKSRQGGAPTPIRMRLGGAMNALNGLSVYALCRELDIDQAAVLEALASYQGAARRQEVVGTGGGVVVIDDFAHHPTAVESTLSAVRGAYPGRRLIAVFEPRSNTSRRAVFQQRYLEALSSADVVAISEVFAKSNDPLAPDQTLSTVRLVDELSECGTAAWSASGPDAILDRLADDAMAGDVIVCMSNGAFGNLPRKLVAQIERRSMGDLSAGA